MPNASRDQNGVPTIIAVLNTNGTTIIPVKASPTSHGIKISNGTTGSDNGTANAKIDENGVRCLIAVSSADGVTPVALYTDLSGNLLTTTS